MYRVGLMPALDSKALLLLLLLLAVLLPEVVPLVELAGAAPLADSMTSVGVLPSKLR